MKGVKFRGNFFLIGENWKEIWGEIEENFFPPQFSYFSLFLWALGRKLGPDIILLFPFLF